MSLDALQAQVSALEAALALAKDDKVALPPSLPPPPIGPHSHI